MLRHFQINVNRDILIFPLFIFIAFIIYFPALHGAFLWDDFGQIVENKYIHTATFSHLFLLFTSSTFYMGNDVIDGIFYRPLMMVYFSFIYNLWGMNTVPYHIIQIILHSCNAFLVYNILKIFTSSKSILLLISLVFLVHPVNVENSVYISNVQDPLFLIFGLSSLVFIRKIPNNTEYIYVCLFFLTLSLFCKETAILFFCVDAFYLYFYNKKYVMRFIVGSACVLCFYVSMRCGFANLCIQSYHRLNIIHVPVITRIVSIPFIVFYYIKSFFLPTTQSLAQHWKTLPGIWYIVLSINILIVEVIHFGYISILPVKRKAYCFWCLWFIIGMLFHLQLIPFEFTVAERWFYFPMIGLLGMISVWMDHHANKLILVVISVLIVLLGIRSYIYSANWKNGITLFKNELEKNDTHEDMYINYGVELYRKGNIYEAFANFTKAVELNPYSQYGWLNLGILYEQTHRMDRAEKAYENAVTKSHYPNLFALDNYITLLIKQKKYNNARDVLKKAMKLYPANKQLIMLDDQINK